MWTEKIQESHHDFLVCIKRLAETLYFTENSFLATDLIISQILFQNMKQHWLINV